MGNPRCTGHVNMLLRTPLLFALVGGCNEDTPVDSTIVQAVQTESKSEKAAAALDAKEKADRERKAAERRALEKKREAELQSAATLPQELPPDLEAACDALVGAYDAFMKSGTEEEVLLWHDGRRKDLGERRAGCVKQGSIELAACGTAALGQPLESLSDLGREEAVRMVLATCADRFQGSPSGGQ